MKLFVRLMMAGCYFIYIVRIDMKKTYTLLFLIILAAAFLRIYKLDQNPPSLYWDEASLGYNAYAIATTGHDEHGEFMPLARFIAFGDYKPPGYIYAIVPFMTIFGVSEFAIRFPSALAGILMVFGTYILVVKMTKNEYAGLFAAILLAISPWDLQLSRSAFEAHLGALANLFGIVLFLGALKRGWLFPLSMIFFAASFYTFNANRILAPLIIILLNLIYFKEIILHKKWILVSIIIGVFLIVPSVSYLRTRESRLRFDEVSIFTNLDIIKKSNERIKRSGNTILSKIIHNRRIYYAKEFLHHYIDHFKGDYLFIHGDRNPRLSVQDVGELYLFELPLLLLGIGLLIKQRSKFSLLIFGWVLLAHIPSSVARETPHMLRTASVLPTYQIVSGLGFSMIFAWMLRQRKLFKYGISFLIILIFCGSLFYYGHNYWIHYRPDWDGEWQYGYKQMVEKVQELEPDYDRIYVTQNLGRPYIYFLLYNQVNPLEYVRVRKAERDWYGLWNVYGYGKYDFTNKIAHSSEKILIVDTNDAFGANGKKLGEVKNLNGKTVFEIGEP